MRTTHNALLGDKEKPSPARQLLPYLLAAGLVALTSAVLWVLRDLLTLANFSLIFLLMTIIVAIWLGTWPSVLAAVLSFFSFNFFLIRPYYTLVVEDPRDLIDLFIFLASALIVGRLTSYAQNQAETSRQVTAEQGILYELTSKLNQLTDRTAVVAELRRVGIEEIGVAQMDVLPGERWVGTAQSSSLYVLLSAGDSIYGTLRAGFAQSPTEAQQRVLAACAVQASLALQRVELAQQARRSEALREADALKTALLRAVSHDLRTPITIIKTSAANLAELDNQLTAEQRHELAHTIELGADRLNALISNLLDMSRLQAGALVLNLEWNSLEEIAGEVAAQTYKSVGAERLSLVFPDDLPLVWCDFGLMVQAVGNLVENSLRYEPEGTQIILSGTADALASTMTIANHGPTIPDAEKELIMEPFYQHDSGGYGAGRTGLGLAIARGIVEALHGRLSIEDTPNGGATFVILLPRETATP